MMPTLNSAVRSRQACRRSRSCAGARDQVADVDPLARLRVGHEADAGRLVLEVEERGDGARRAREGRVARRRRARARSPTQIRRSSFETLEKLLAGPRGHGIGTARPKPRTRSAPRAAVSISRASACPARPSISPSSAVSRRTIRRPSVGRQPRAASAFSHWTVCSTRCEAKRWRRKRTSTSYWIHCVGRAMASAGRSPSRRSVSDRAPATRARISLIAARDVDQRRRRQLRRPRPAWDRRRRAPPRSRSARRSAPR